MRTFIRVTDFISEWTGKAVCWLCVALVMVLCYEVQARYVFGAPTIWAHETSRMLSLTIIALGWAYVQKHHRHIRVDVIYACLPSRGKIIIDIVGSLLLFFPLIVLLTYAAADSMWFSWSIGERMHETFWYPPAAPVRTVLFLGLSLFGLQGMAQLIRDIYLLIRNKPL